MQEYLVMMQGILDSLSGDWLSIKLSDKLRNMKGFRNILVHGYAKLNDELVYTNIYEGKYDVHQFIEEVTACLDRL